MYFSILNPFYFIFRLDVYKILLDKIKYYIKFRIIHILLNFSNLYIESLKLILLL